MFDRNRTAHRSPHSPGSRCARFEQLESRCLLTAFGAGANDTGEFLLGDVRVNLVLLESTGAENTENWTAEGTPTSIQAIKTKVDLGLKYWTDLLATQTSVHSLKFDVDTTHADAPLATSIEPISHRSNDYTIYVNEFLAHVGHDDSNSISENIRSYNDAQRDEKSADWSFTIFVVNNENDFDKLFASGGSFRRAFAFAGGRFIVIPADRPEWIFAHEIGHMFWARDEYAGGGSYNDEERGYYGTRNLNAVGNPSGSQVDSIMAEETLVENAYNNVTSSPSSMAMVGWQDTDNDGIFDVLDVDHELTGDGYYDSQNSRYHFVGSASVQTLPNRNKSGFINDITTNEIDVVEYKVGAGDWTPLLTPGTPQVDLDLSIPITDNTFVQTIQIRTRSVDAVTEQTAAASPVFTATTDTIGTVAVPGINGFVWDDVDRDGEWDDGEAGLADIQVRLIDESGDPLIGPLGVEPDDFGQFESLSNPAPGITLTATGSDVQNGIVRSRASANSSTGSRVFALRRVNGFDSTSWNQENRILRIEFDEPISLVSLDAIGNGNGDVGRLDAFDENNNLVARYTTGSLQQGEVETMQVTTTTAEIKYVLAAGHMAVDVQLDNLQYGPTPSVVTNTNGVFHIAYLAAGDYRVEAIAPAGLTATTATVQDVAVSDTPVEGVSFGFAMPATPAWQNADDPLDVNDDGSVSPADALEVINRLNGEGPGKLPDITPELRPPPFLDVNGDGSVSPSDALIVINFLNNSPNGEAEADGVAFTSNTSSLAAATSTGLTGGGDVDEDVAEGEFVGYSGQAVEKRARDVGQEDAEPGSDRPHGPFAAANHAWRRIGRQVHSSTRKSESEDDEAASLLDLLAVDVLQAWSATK